MLSAIKGFSDGVYQSMPTIRLNTPANMLQRMQNVAIPAMVAFGASQVQGAEAIGTIGCVLCVAGAAAAGGVGIAACIPICVLAGVTITVPIF